MSPSARVNRGLLLTMTEPPPGMAEEEFNAWYDSEHIPERLSIHVTLYELADSNVDLPGALRVYRAYAA